MSVQAVLGDAVEAAVGVVSGQGPEVANLVRRQVKSLAHHFEDIADGIASGEIDHDTAKLLFQMVKNNAIGAVALATNATAIVVEKAINAAIAVFRTAIGTAVGALVPG